MRYKERKKKGGKKEENKGNPQILYNQEKILDSYQREGWPEEAWFWFWSWSFPFRINLFFVHVMKSFSFKYLLMSFCIFFFPIYTQEIRTTSTFLSIQEINIDSFELEIIKLKCFSQILIINNQFIIMVIPNLQTQNMYVQ